jgi:hypothetical protein
VAKAAFFVALGHFSLIQVKLAATFVRPGLNQTTAQRNAQFRNVLLGSTTRPRPAHALQHSVQTARLGDTQIK